VRINPLGVVLIIVMLAGFTYGFLGTGTFAGYCLLLAALILLFVAGATFTRGGRAGKARTIRDLQEAIEEARRERERKGEGAS
jgi:hypothetical protein